MQNTSHVFMSNSDAKTMPEKTKVQSPRKQARKKSTPDPTETPPRKQKKKTHLKAGDQIESIDSLRRRFKYDPLGIVSNFVEIPLA